MDNVFVGLGLTVIIALIVFTILVKLYEFFKNKKQNYPYEDEIEEIVLPFVYRGIFSAFKASEYFVDKFGNRLDGVDKKKLADSLYDLLPFSICVKFIIYLSSFIFGFYPFIYMLLYFSICFFHSFLSFFNI